MATAYPGLKITKGIWLSGGQVAQKSTCLNVFMLVRVYWPPINWTTSWFYRTCPGDKCLLNLLVPHHFYLSRTKGQSVFSNPAIQESQLMTSGHMSLYPFNSKARVFRVSLIRTLPTEMSEKERAGRYWSCNVQCNAIWLWSVLRPRTQKAVNIYICLRKSWGYCSKVNYSGTLTSQDVCQKAKYNFLETDYLWCKCRSSIGPFRGRPLIIWGGAWCGFSRTNFFFGDPPNEIFFSATLWTFFFLIFLAKLIEEFFFFNNMV